MSTVMIRCPATRRAVSTAIETEPSEFQKLPNVMARMHCPACGQDHVWTIGAAWLADGSWVAEYMATPADVAA